jgi:hypothetical protein
VFHGLLNGDGCAIASILSNVGESGVGIARQGLLHCRHCRVPYRRRAPRPSKLHGHGMRQSTRLARERFTLDRAPTFWGRVGWLALLLVSCARVTPGVPASSLPAVSPPAIGSVVAPSVALAMPAAEASVADPEGWLSLHGRSNLPKDVRGLADCTRAMIGAPSREALVCTGGSPEPVLDPGGQSLFALRVVYPAQGSAVMALRVPIAAGPLAPPDAKAKGAGDLGDGLYVRLLPTVAPDGMSITMDDDPTRTCAEALSKADADHASDEAIYVIRIACGARGRYDWAQSGFGRISVVQPGTWLAERGVTTVPRAIDLWSDCEAITVGKPSREALLCKGPPEVPDGVRPERFGGQKHLSVNRRLCRSKGRAHRARRSVRRRSRR